MSAPGREVRRFAFARDLAMALGAQLVFTRLPQNLDEIPMYARAVVDFATHVARELFQHEPEVPWFREGPPAEKGAPAGSRCERCGGAFVLGERVYLEGPLAHWPWCPPFAEGKP